MMTKRDFKAIADAIADACLDPSAAYAVVADIADACARSNPRFDRGKFFRACGLRPEFWGIK